MRLMTKQRLASILCVLCFTLQQQQVFAGWSERWDNFVNETKQSASEAWTNAKRNASDAWDKTKQSVSEGLGEAGEWVSDHKEEIGTVIAVAVAIYVGHEINSQSCDRPTRSTRYTYKDSHSAEGAYKPFSQAQKAEILRQNRERNGGVLRSDFSGKVLEEPQRYTKGYTPSLSEAQVDHIKPRSHGGWNSAENAQVLSREENLNKSDNTKWGK